MARDALRRLGYREAASTSNGPALGPRATFRSSSTRAGRCRPASATAPGVPPMRSSTTRARTPQSDFAWFQDRVSPRSLTSEGWPDEALTLVWRPVDEGWLPESRRRSGADSRRRVVSVDRLGDAGRRQPDPGRFLAFKSGSLAANHSHLDLNHVSVGVGETMLLVDLGSRSYPATTSRRRVTVTTRSRRPATTASSSAAGARARTSPDSFASFRRLDVRGVHRRRRQRV